MGLLSHREACPTCLARKWVPTGWQGPEEDAFNVDTHSTRTRGSGPLGFLKCIEISETLERKPVKRADVSHGSCLRWREMKTFLGNSGLRSQPRGCRLQVWAVLTAEKALHGVAAGQPHGCLPRVGGQCGVGPIGQQEPDGLQVVVDHCVMNWPVEVTQGEDNRAQVGIGVSRPQAASSGRSKMR